MAKDKLTVYVGEDLKKKAKEKAKQEDTSVSRKIRMTLRKWVGDDPPKDEED